jgi:uncharacterized protein YlxW (UPF0749 family)
VRIRASLAAVLALTGFLVVVAAEGVGDTRRASESRRSGLVELIRRRQHDVDDLGEMVVALRGELQAVRHHLSSESAGDARRLEDLQIRAGTVPLAGPGLEVVLSDSARPARNPAEKDALSVHDVDLQLVVNALWAAGAEAIAVNGQRLVATSPIRGAGETITVNFRPLAPPYRIRALGAEPVRFEKSATARRYHRWSSEVGLGFGVKPRSRLRVAGFRGAVQLGTAESVPAGEETRPDPTGSPEEPVPSGGDGGR